MERLMRTEKMYDPKADFYALKEFKFGGRDYSRGNGFPSRDITNRKLLQLFQNGFIGYESDFKTNKTNMKEVEVEKKEEVEVKEEAPKQTQTTRNKRRNTKKDSE